MKELRIAVLVLLLCVAAGGLWVLRKQLPVTHLPQWLQQSGSAGIVSGDELVRIDTEIETQIQQLQDTPSVAPEVSVGELDVPVDDFHAAYQQAASQHSTYSEYALLRELYANQKNSDLLPYLIHSAIEVRYYDDAVAYMNILLSEGTLFEKIEPSVFIEVLLSVDELTLSVLANIKALVYDYTQAGLLTEQQQKLFFALIAFSKGDIDNYGYFVETLTGEYLPRKVSYDRAKAAVFQYAEPPLYYLDGLLALDLFTRGWYTLSRLTAQRLLAVDPNYVLTYQLLSYTNLYTHKPGRAVPYLEKLMQLDPPNEQLYRFLLGVAHYEDKNRAASILAFRKVTDEQYQADTQRYLMLLQLEIEDSEEFVTAVEQLLVLPDLTPFDFYTLFDRLYYDEQHSDFAQEVFAVAPDVAQQIDGRCHELLSQDYGYVCLFGKAGSYVQAGDVSRAYRYLQLLTQRYPRKEVYQRLGDLAFQLGLDEESKRWHIKAVLTEQTMRSVGDISGEIRAILELKK